MQELTPQVVLPADHPMWKGQQSLWFELKDNNQRPLPVILEERVGSKVFVRRPNAGEVGGRIEVRPRDEIYLVTPVAGLFLSESSQIGNQADTLFFRPIRQTGRDGHKVFVEMIGPGEPAPSKPVYLGPGDEIVFPPGSIAVSFDAIDAALGGAEAGYRPVADSVWTWLRYSSQSQGAHPGVVYLVTAAQKLDLSYELLKSIGNLALELESAEYGPHLRKTTFDVVARSHTIAILLHRAFKMLHDAGRRLRVRAPSPKPLRGTMRELEDLRNAIEHAEEHSLSVGTATPFDWHHIIRNGELTLGGVSFDIIKDTEAALLLARDYLARLVDAPSVPQNVLDSHKDAQQNHQANARPRPKFTV